MVPLLGFTEGGRAKFRGSQPSWAGGGIWDGQHTSQQFGAGGMLSQSPGRIQKLDPPWGSVIYIIQSLESRIGGSIFWIPVSCLKDWMCGKAEMVRGFRAWTQGEALGLRVSPGRRGSARLRLKVFRLGQQYISPASSALPDVARFGS